MADIKTFKDIDKKLQKLVDETKKNFNVTKRWQEKLDDHAIDLIDKVEAGKKPKAKIQKEMLRILEVSEAQDKVRAHDRIVADFKIGKATIEQLRAVRLSKEDFIQSGFGMIGSNIEMMRQSWQETIGKFGIAVKNWWKWTKENSIVLQAAKKFWNSEAIKKLRGMVSEVAGIIKGHMSDVLGEFQQVFDFMKQSISLVYKSITGAFTGFFDIISQRRKERREQKMVKHLEKIKDGIGFLVKGEKIDKISSVKKAKGNFIDRILDMLGLSGILLGGAAALLFGLKAALIGLVTKFLLDSVKAAIKGWRERGLAGAMEGALVSFTHIPRKIIGWIGEKILDYIGLDGTKFKEALSDESTQEFIKKMQKIISDFLDTVYDFTTDIFFKIKDSIADLWNNISYMPESMKIGIGGSESYDDALAAEKRLKGHIKNQTGAKNILSVAERASKSLAQAQKDEKTKESRGLGSKEASERLKSIEIYLKGVLETLKPANVNIQTQNNSVNSPGNSTGSGVIDPDLQATNSAMGILF